MLGSDGPCLQATPHLNCHISQLIPPIGEFLSILEFGRHRLYNAHGLTLVTPSLCGQKMFLTHMALIHIRITWALSPIAQQIMGATMGSPLCPWRGAQHKSYWLYMLLVAILVGCISVVALVLVRLVFGCISFQCICSWLYQLWQYQFFLTLPLVALASAYISFLSHQHLKLRNIR